MMLLRTSICGIVGVMLSLAMLLQVYYNFASYLLNVPKNVVVLLAFTNMETNDAFNMFSLFAKSSELKFSSFIF